MIAALAFALALSPEQAGGTPGHSGGGAPEQAGSLVTYTLVETVKAVTPAGERSNALSGVVRVAENGARWELSPGSAFPRSTATALIAEGGRLTLLDARQELSAEMPLEELPVLFATGAGESSGAGSVLADKAISVERDGAGKAFDGSPTLRYRITANVVSRVTTPGRVSTVRSVYRGSLEVVDGLPEAASPFDELLRLFPFRGEAREELADRLTAVKGFPVRFVLEGESEMSFEPVGGARLPDGSERPPRTTVRIERTVSQLSKRRLLEADRALFAPPESYRTRGAEVLLASPAAIR